jgi:prepilin-type N-terminal cleavage/methylation domain-containing protein
MYKKLQNKTEGFTIIEVLIVLAIAGLIMLIVFLAVPALQRNSRNTQRTNDVARMSAAVNECLNNNNGLVASCDDFGAAQLSEYIDITTNQQIEEIGSAGLNSAAFEYSTVCVPDGTDSTSGGGNRSFTLVYEIETNNGGTAGRCVGS